MRPTRLPAYRFNIQRMASPIRKALFFIFIKYFPNILIQWLDIIGIIFIDLHIYKNKLLF